jgi:hypothetical protein
MKLVTNTVPIAPMNIKYSDDGKITTENLIPAGTIFKVVAVDSFNVYLESKDRGVQVSGRIYDMFFVEQELVL